MNSLIGKEIDDYYISDELSQTDFALTFKAIHKTTGRVVVLKLLPPLSPFDAKDKLALESLKQEIKVLKKLSHPYIVQLLDEGVFQGSIYLVRDYKADGTLRDHLELHKEGLEIQAALSIFRNIASAIDYIHSRNVIHRDLKPENIMIEYSGEEVHPFIADFGLATPITKSTYSTKGLIGTPLYAPPEMWDYSLDRTYKVDIYSMGLMFYEAVTGVNPFAGFQDPHQVMNAKLNKVIPMKGIQNARVAKALKKSLSRNPRNRYESAKSLIDDLDEALKDNATLKGDTRRWQIGIVIAILAIIATLVAGLIARPEPITPTPISDYPPPTMLPTMGITLVPTSTLFPTVSPVPPTSTATLTSTYTFSPPSPVPTTLIPSLTVTDTPLPITFTLTATITNTASPTTANCTISTNGININIRAKPGTGAKALTSVKQSGTVFVVKGRTDDGSWWQINYQEQSAWIAASVVTSSGDCVNIPYLSEPTIAAPPTPVPQPTAQVIPTGNVVPQSTNVPTTNYINGGTVHCGDSFKGNFSGSNPPNNFYTIDMAPESKLTVSFSVIAGNTNGDLAIAIFPPGATYMFIGGGRTDAIAYGKTTISTGVLAGGTYSIGVGSGFGGFYSGFGITPSIYKLGISCN